MDVFAVEAFAASWIEILLRFNQNSSFKSKPLRLRGLKLNLLASRIQLLEVEAFAASWIEIILKWHKIHCIFVEAFAASWIEIF